MQIKIRTMVSDIEVEVVDSKEIDILLADGEVDIIAPGSGDETVEVMIVRFIDEGETILAPYLKLGASAYLLYKVPYDVEELGREV